MAVPTVTGIDPGSGPPGTMVVITGTNFDESVSLVEFGAVSSGTNFSCISDTAIAAYVPAGTGTVNVYVTNSSGKSAAGIQWTYDAAVGPPGGGGGVVPTIVSVVPDESADDEGEGGDSVTITGTGFTTALAVYFGGVQAAFEIVSDTEITAIAPQGSGTVDVLVDNSYGTSPEPGAANDFTYPTIAAPTVSSVSPSTGFPGIHVTIVGTGFTNATVVEFGTEHAIFSITDATHIDAIVPYKATAGAVDVEVTNPGGTSADGIQFTYGARVGPKTTAVGLVGTPYAGWVAGPVNVSLSAVDTGGPGIESIWYRVNGGAITKYSGAFNVVPVGCNTVEYWAIALDGLIENVNLGYANIVTVSSVPTGLSVTAGLGYLFVEWDNIFKERPVSYKVYWGNENPPTDFSQATGSNVMVIKRNAADGLTYVAVTSIDYNGTESAKCVAVSATPLQATAGDIADDAITAAKLAPGIQPPIIVGALPALPNAAYPEGAIVYLTADNCLYKTTDGSNWTKLVGAGDIVANCLTAGQIAAGAIGVDELAAQSVWVKHLTVANFDNLVPNANSEQDTSGAPAGAIEAVAVSTDFAYSGTHSRKVVGGAGYTGSEITDFIPVQKDEEYHLECMGRLDVADAAGHGWYIQLRTFDSAKAHVGYVASSGFKYSTSWQLGEANYTIPDGVAFIKLMVLSYAIAGKNAYFDNLLLRRRSAGSLIVDGTITADHLAVGTITSASACIASLSANWITAGTMSCDRLSGGTINGQTISGGTITGSLIRTASSGQRTELKSDYMGVKFYSGAAGETAPASIIAQNLAPGGITYVYGPNFGFGQVYLALVGTNTSKYAQLYADSDAHIQVNATGVITLTATTITLSSSDINLGATDINGLLQVTGKIYPATNWASRTSADGIWIQDSSTVGNRWKLYYNSSQDKLYVALADDHYHSVQFS